MCVCYSFAIRIIELFESNQQCKQTHTLHLSPSLFNFISLTPSTYLDKNTLQKSNRARNKLWKLQYLHAGYRVPLVFAFVHSINCGCGKCAHDCDSLYNCPKQFGKFISLHFLFRLAFICRVRLGVIFPFTGIFTESTR